MAVKLISDLDRLASKCEYVEESGCWKWIDRLDKDGYAARAKVGSRTDGSRREVRPQRWFYEEFVEPIPKGFVTDHICRNRACVNPWHMEPVTSLVNHERGLRARYFACPLGHVIAGENEILRPGGHRCRICFNARAAAYRKSNGNKYQREYQQRRRRK